MFNFDEMLQPEKQFSENCDTSSNNRLTLFGTIPRFHYISSNIKCDIAIRKRLIHSRVN